MTNSFSIYAKRFLFSTCDLFYYLNSKNNFAIYYPINIHILWFFFVFRTLFQVTKIATTTTTTIIIINSFLIQEKKCDLVLVYKVISFFCLLKFVHNMLNSYAGWLGRFIIFFILFFLQHFNFHRKVINYKSI